MLYNYIPIFVWFICDTILYNILVCMRLLCLTMYICIYCGMICLLCAHLRSGGKFCHYALLWNNCAHLQHRSKSAYYTWQYLQVNYTPKSIYHFKRYKARLSDFIILAYKNTLKHFTSLKRHNIKHIALYKTISRIYPNHVQSPNIFRTLCEIGSESNTNFGKK